MGPHRGYGLGEETRAPRPRGSRQMAETRQRSAGWIRQTAAAAVRTALASAQMGMEELVPSPLCLSPLRRRAALRWPRRDPQVGLGTAGTKPPARPKLLSWGGRPRGRGRGDARHRDGPQHPAPAMARPPVQRSHQPGTRVAPGTRGDTCVTSARIEVAALGAQPPAARPAVPGGVPW